MTALVQIIKSRYIGVVMVVWVVSLLYMGFVGNSNETPLDNLKLELYEKTMKQLLELKEQNKKLAGHIHDLKKTQELLQYKKVPVSENNQRIEISKASKPSREHEILRRRIQNDVRETWFFIHQQLESFKIPNRAKNQTTFMNSIQKDIFEYYSITANDLVSLSRVDGMEAWKREQSKVLAEVVQDVIHKLQNPADCNTTKLLVCNLGKGCGFGCQLHHLLYCIITAIATQRTFIINSKNWRYLDNGWSEFFIPPNTECYQRNILNPPFWTGNDNDKRVIQLPIIDVLSPRPAFLPLAVPSQLYNTLVTIHGDPFVWWAGQLLTYIMRPQPSLARDMMAVDRQLGFSNVPYIVGVHIRRTDKLASEASYHSLAEYMWHVERHYDKLDLLEDVATPRAIYLASDDPKVFQEAIDKYPSYTVIGSRQFAEKASLNSRYSRESLRSIILDVHFLSRTQYLVCTFSSQVSRLAYELMQTFHRDDATSFRSLDDIFYYGGQNGHRQVARFDHFAPDPGSISLTKGEIIGVAGNHWDGFSMGAKEGSVRQGLYPSIKVLEKVPQVHFPAFAEYFKSAEFKDKYKGNAFAPKVEEMMGNFAGGGGGGVKVNGGFGGDDNGGNDGGLLGDGGADNGNGGGDGGNGGGGL